MKLPVPFLLAAAILPMATAAKADLKVRLPHVGWGELEFEHNGLVTFAAKGAPGDRAGSFTNSIAYGLTPWWQIELEAEAATAPGRSATWNALTLENTFQLTERGQYLFDVGFFMEYSHATGKGADSVKFGPILHREINNVFGIDTAHTLNVFVARDVGPNASRDTTLQMAWQSVARLHPLFAPGIEYFAEIAKVAHTGTYDQQQHFAGPVLTGAQSFAPFGKLKYQVGYLFGTTTATPKSAIRWKLEYEIRF